MGLTQDPTGGQGAPGGDTPPSGGQPGTGTPPGQGQATWKDGSAFDPERAASTIASLSGYKDLSEKQQKELDDLRAKLKGFEDRDLSELDKLRRDAEAAQKERDEAQAKARDLELRGEITRVARQLGFVDEDDAVLYVDRNKLVLDDDGRPKNLKDLLEGVLKAKPHLARSGDGAQTQRSGPPSTPQRQGGMSREQAIAARKEQIGSAGGRYAPY